MARPKTFCISSEKLKDFFPIYSYTLKSPYPVLFVRLSVPSFFVRHMYFIFDSMEDNPNFLTSYQIKKQLHVQVHFIFILPVSLWIESQTLHPLDLWLICMLNKTISLSLNNNANINHIWHIYIFILKKNGIGASFIRWK